MYSPDDGATWSLQASDVSDSGIELDATNIAGGTTQGRFKVLATDVATDGIHTSADLSDDAVTMPNPTSIWLDASNRFYEDTLYIENLNYNHAIQWQAQASEPWLRFSVNEGNTPQEIAVFADPSGLQPGIYTATISITSADVPGQRQVVGINVLVTDHPTLFMPVILR